MKSNLYLYLHTTLAAALFAAAAAAAEEPAAKTDEAEAEAPVAPMAGPFRPDTPPNPPEKAEPQKPVKSLGDLAKEEAALRPRVQARWNALIAMDMAKVYEFATPSYRKANNLAHLNNQYAAQVQRKSVEIRSVRFEDGKLPAAKVEVTLYFQTDGFDGGAPLNLDAQIQETWVKDEGQWWYVEPR